VHERVSAVARRQPEALAVAAGTERLTYGALEARSNRLAHHLGSLGVGPESRVAIFMERTPARMVAVLAVLKAGGAYVSLDPANPAERLAFQIADSSSAVVLTQSDLADRLPTVRAVVLTVDGGWSDSRREDAPPRVRLDPENLAYVVYTSGSTGLPKGVEIRHAGLWNLVAWHQELYAVTAADRATVVANPAFDASVWEIWPYLTAGASLHIPEEAVRLSPDRLARWWAAEGITLSFLPTPLAEAVMTEELPAGLALRALITGGDLLHRGPVPGAPFRLMNHYGPSEASVVSTVAPVEEGEAGLPPIGRPIANLRVHVLDEDGELAPVGEAGELCVAGVGLARGYLGRPDLTAGSFVPDPFAPAPGERMYRTGDLVRWREDGNLDFLGRIDHQVKVRGLRIELGEIEAALARHPAVRKAAVLLRAGRLVACVAAPGEPRPDAAELRSLLAERLPDYMVPAVFVMLDALPLSPNGKVDRRALEEIALPAPTPARPDRTGSPLEEALAGIWAEVLGVPRVGLDDDFFSLGGHSLLATRVLSRVRRSLGVALQPRVLFEAPTVAGLARIVDRTQGDVSEVVEPEPAPVAARPEGAGLPLSYAQRRLWFLDRLTPGSSVYNVPLPLRLEGRLDAAALAASLAEIVRRHEVLRTTYENGEDGPVQVIHPPAAFPLPVADLSALPAELRRRESQRLLGADAARPFDLAAGPVLRASLLRLGGAEHLLLLAVHHIAFDGWSLDVLLREMADLYAAVGAGRPSPLPELPMQYADYASWQRDWLQGELLVEQLGYWQRQLAGAEPVLDLPTDRPRPPVQSFRGARAEVVLPAGPAAELRRLAKREQLSLFMPVLAAFQALLQRITGRDDVLVGSAAANRGRLEIEGLIGFFANTVVLRGDLTGDPAFYEVAARAREVTLQAAAHQDLPFDRLVEELRLDRDLACSPLVQVVLILETAPHAAPGLPGLHLEYLDLGNGTAKFDLVLSLTQQDDGGLRGWIEYATDLFEAATIERLSGYFRTLLAVAVAEPERRLSELPLFTPGERAEALLAGEPEVAFRRDQARSGRIDHRMKGIEAAPVAPRTPVEATLAEIFAGLLGVAAVGVDDDFFVLGGHSLLAAQAISRIFRLLGVELPLRRMFEAPTVAQMARCVEEAQAAEAALPAPQSQETAASVVEKPLSFAQQRLWFLDQLTPGSDVYNIPFPLRLEGCLEPAALAAALGEIVRRHQVLRTTYTAGEETDPFQVVHPPRPFPLPVVDLAGLSVELRSRESTRLAGEDARGPFDLTAGPVFRASLLRLGAVEHMLLLGVHHIAFDGWSAGLLLSELATLYAAATAGRPSPLPELPWQYADFAAWQRSWLTGDVYAGQLAFWRRALDGAPELLELPADHPRPPVQSLHGAVLRSRLPTDLSSALRTLGREQGQTLFMLLLAGFQALLQRYAGQDDLLVGTPVAGRHRAEVEELIGCFINTLVLRGDLADDPSFGELLARTREVCLAAYAHQDLPFEALVEELRLERDLSRSPLVQVMLVLQNARREMPLPAGLRLVPLEAEVHAAKLDLTLEIVEEGDELLLSLEYATDLFEAATIERLAGHFQILLAGAVAAGERPLSELPLLSTGEQQQLAAWNTTGEPRPAGATLQGLFAAQAARTPEAVAVLAAEGTLTYGELDARSDRLARRLMVLSARIDARVGLFLERSLEMVVALLGVLKAGMAYVPLDPDYPADRLAAMLEDAEVAAVLTQERLADRLMNQTTAGVPVLCLDSGWDQEAGGSLLPAVPDEALAYLIFTSGSTGRPKATMVPHRAIVNHMLWMQAELPLAPADRVLQKTAFSFDASVWEFWAPLLAGATLVMARPGEHREPAALIRSIREHGVTVLQTVPSLLRALLEDGRLGECRTLRRVFCGGEALGADVQTAFFGTLDAELVNLYGPTETTVEVTFWRCERERADRPALLGGPIANARLHVLGRRLEPCPVGVPGEFHVGGVPVSRGYLGRPGDTASRFLPDPFAAVPGERLYRTGDLVRQRPDGLLEYLGRTDHQVKVRGFRIEPGEVEAVLADHPGVAQAVVLALPDAAGSSRLVGYVAGVAGAVPEGAGLRAYLKERLPEHMVPSGFVVLESLPLTPNGKVDRQALAKLEPGVERGGELTAPRTPVEETLAAIFAKLLGVATVGVDDDFFALGGHSLLAVRVVAEIRRSLGREVPVRTVFEQPTVAGLARVLAAREGGAVANLPALTVKPRSAGPLTLSYSQQRLWFLDQLTPGSHAYNIPFPLHVEGPLEPAVLATALSEIVRRHEVLRTTFAAGEGEPCQVIHPVRPLPLPVVDLAALPAETRRREALRLAEEDALRPFDLAAGPVLRASLVRLGAAEHVLLLGVHHIAFDGWSAGLLLSELATLYDAATAGRPSPLPELPWQYADFAAWQRSWLTGDVYARQLAFWRRTLDGAPELLELPSDHLRPPVQSLRGEVLRSRLPADLSSALRSLGRERGQTLFMLLLAGFQALLQRYTGQDDLVIGTPVAGRHRAEVEELIGFFVNTLALRADLAGDPAFGELLARTREACLAAFAHEDLPFEALVEELRPERDLSRSPLVQVLLIFQSAQHRTRQPAGLRLVPLEADLHAAKFDLTLAVTEEADELVLELEYATDLFEATTVERLTSHLRSLLAVVAADPQRRLSELPLLAAGEAAQILVEWNDTAILPAPRAQETCLHQLFEAQAARTPEAVALIAADGGRLTYRELDARAARLARRLWGLGVGPEVLVGVMMDRTPDLVVALLAVLKAGGAYVPIDPAYPAPRVAFMLESSGAAVLLTRRALVAELAGGLPSAAVPLFLDAGWEAAPELPEWPAPSPVSGNLAYVIYTSGSTGTPKGVALEHRSAVAFLHWARTVYSPDEFAVVLAATSVCFDLSIFEIFATLVWGGTLALAENALALSAHPVAGELTMINTVPSTMAELVRAGAIPPRVRTINLAGEALKGALVRGIYERTGVEKVYNLYGPSEDTTYSTFALMPRDVVSPVIGRPLAGTSAYVLDGVLAPVPVGVPGAVYLSGDGLARGYLGRPDLTADRFIPNPFGPPGSRLYRTGDLARFRPDGELDFLGRIDHQVKVRGFRIELGEVEAALASLPAVRQSAVLALPEPGGEGPRLTAFVVSAGPIPPLTELRTALRRILPEHMVPTAFTFLAELPLTPNGKLDRRILERLVPEDESLASIGSISGIGGHGGAPRTPVEELVAGLWCEVLGVERVGVDDSFFDLGGHSLLVTRVISRLRQTFGVDLPMRALFEAPTVAALARRVEEARAGDRDGDGDRDGHGPELPTLRPAPRDGRGLPLSYAQGRLWLLDRLEPGSPLYNMPQAMALDGALDRPALEAALSEILRRHEVLRTRFAEEAGEPVQLVQPAAPFILPLVDLSTTADRLAEAQRLADAEAVRPFDLSRPPLLRAVLLRLAPEEHRLLLTLHHIASDGWSQAPLLRELTVLYAAFAAGRPSPLPELPLQYADFAAWQRRWLTSERLAAELSHWKERLSGVPDVLELPADRPRPAVRSHRGALRGRELAPELTAALHRLARREGVTLFMLLLAAFDALLYRYALQERFLVGSPIANRNRAEIEELIGFFINTLVLRADPAGDLPFRDLLRRVRETTLEAYDHQDLPFEKLVEELRPERSLALTPLFQVMLVLQNAPNALTAEAGLPGLSLRALETSSRTAKFDLTLSFADSGPALWVDLEYATDLFDAATMERLLSHMACLLAGVVAAPGDPLSELSLLSREEAAQVRDEWNDTAAAYPQEHCLHELIAAQAALDPERVAVTSEAGSLTCRALEAAADRLARRLRDLGVEPEVPVGICAERSLEMVVGLLAVLKAGGAYLPLDPDYPPDRLAYMLADSRVPVVLVQERFLAALPPHDAMMVALDGVAAVGEETTTPFASGAGPDNLAYVIYTSGSTGRPKGTMNSHRGIVNRLLWMQERYGLTAADRVLQKTPFSFDVSVWEFFWPLLTSARLVMARPGGHRDSAYLVATLQAEEITTLHFVPSMLQAFLEDPGVERCTGVQRVLCSGEALPYELERRFFQRLPGVELHNLYGPTEAAVDVTSWACEPSGERSAVPIGRPVANTGIHLVDPWLRPVPVGIAGELLIGGVQVGRGYLARPDLTAERFVPDPFAKVPGARLYRTGDLARFLPDGAVDYLGRIDHQVKVRGFRIEPGEIEAALICLPGVREAAVVAREDVTGDRRLVAYVVPTGGETSATAPALAIPELRRALAASLPEHMVPSAFVVLPALPLNPNGKLDRKALPKPDVAGQERAFMPPSGPIEELLAGLWCEVLGVERVGVDDSFFDLGGHSLLVTRVISRLRRAFGVDLPMRALFEAPTVAALARRVEEARAGDRGGRDRDDHGAELPPLRPAPRDGRGLPLSYAQGRLWLLDRLEPGSAQYNIPQALELRGALAPAALAAALAAIVRRHEVLRTRFAEVDGEPVQIPEPASPFTLPLVDLSALPGEQERLDAAGWLATAEAARPFDLSRPPLLRAVLLRLGPEEHRLLLTLHHIASDGWSQGILDRELAALYAAEVRGEPSPLPEVPIQYADFAAWQRSWMAGEILDRELSWWRERLARVPDVLDLPTDRPRPAVRSSRGAYLAMRLPDVAAEGLTRLARREGVTSFMVMLAAFEALLHRYTGQEGFLVGTPIANRTRAEIEGLVGFFVNTLVLRADLAGNPDFRELLRRTREVTLESYDHQDVPFEKLVEELRPERRLSHTPLFQVMLVTQNAAAGAAELPGLMVRPLPVESGTTKFDLTLALEEREGGLEAGVEYSTELFDAPTIERLCRHFGTLLGAAIAVDQRERGIGELPLLTPGERHELLAAWNDTGRDFGLRGRALVHEQVAEQARRRPEALAVAAGPRRLTYGELEARSNGLAHRLRALGVGVGLESRVAVFMERTPERVVALLAVLKAGGAYVSLDPAHPRERLAFQIADAGSPVVLTQTALAGRLPELRVPVILLDGGLDGDGMGTRPDAPPVEVVPESLAYVIYTSGSTGIPKGVEIPHRGLANLVAWHRDLYAVTPEDRATQVANPAFDASVWEVWPYLTAGASLHVPEEPVRVEPEALARWLAAEAITLSFLPTPLAEAMLDGELPADLALRALIVGGDRLHRGPVPGAAFRLMNHYGPSEVSVVSTVEPVEGDGVPSIGRPIANLRVYVVDFRGEPVPVGVPGELCIAGVGLARGYLARPDLTAEAFVPDPFTVADHAGERMYRTGDLVRWGREAKLEFLGRIDNQVKIRGLRIELGEIEAALAAHPQVREAAVLLREGRLVAYLSPVLSEMNPEAEELRAFLLARLPDYMVPAALVTLDALPLSANGKVDRQALAALPPPTAATAAAEGPRTPVEAALAAIWAELLGLDGVGVHDNFFELGGHSLLATRVVARVRSVLGVDLPLVRLFEAPTVSGLAALVEAAARQAVPLPPIARTPRAPGTQEGLPPSLAQQRLWLLDRVDPGSPAFNVPTPFRVHGLLDVAALTAALTALVRRHEALRTVFAENEGHPRQLTLPAAAVPLPVLDLTALPSVPREAEALRWAGEEGRLPFDLARGPLFRASLARLGSEEHVLCLNAHHVVTDGWSAEILVRELQVLYGAVRDGRPAALPELPLQYPDFAVWQRRSLSADAVAALLARWRERFGTDLPVLRLPTDRPRPAVQTVRGAHRSVRLPREVTEAARALSNRRGATLFMTFLAAFQALLHRYSRQPRIVVGSPMAGRGRPELEGIVGFFVNTVVLPVDVAGDLPFEVLVDRARDAALGAYALQDLPFEKVVEALQPERDRSRSPLFQVMFTFQDGRFRDDRAAGEAPLALEPLEISNQTSQFDLSLFTADLDDGLWVGVEYNTDLFAAATIDRLLDHYGRLLAAAVAMPATPVAELPPAEEEIPRPAEPRMGGEAATEAAAPDTDARRDRLAARMSKLSQAQREALDRRLRGGGAA
jgi:amino acid adenylation domain-containing protein